MSLADRIRASREEWVTVGGYELNVRRPTDVQLARWQQEGSDRMRLVTMSVVDWKIPEKDLVAGGGGKVPPFDTEAFREWIEDRVDLVVELAQKIISIINAYADKQQELEKNS